MADTNRIAVELNEAERNALLDIARRHDDLTGFQADLLAQVVRKIEAAR